MITGDLLLMVVLKSCLHYKPGIKIWNFYKDTLCFQRRIFGINAQTHENECRSHKFSVEDASF